MNLDKLRQMIEEVMAAGGGLNEEERHQTDKGFRPVVSAVMRLFGDEPLLRKLSANAINQVLAIIYEDLNS